MPAEFRRDEDDKNDDIIITDDMIAMPEDINIKIQMKNEFLEGKNGDGCHEPKEDNNMSLDSAVEHENKYKPTDEDLLDEEEEDQAFINALKGFNKDEPEDDEKELIDKTNEAADLEKELEKGEICSDSDDDQMVVEVDAPKTLDFFSMRDKIVEKKELKAIDHKTIEYEPFRKN